MHILATWLFQIRTTNEDDLRRGRTSIVAALIMIGLAILALPISAISTNPISSIATLAIGIIAYLISIITIRAGFINAGGLILINFVTLPILVPIALNTLSNGSVTLPFYLALSLLVAGIILRPPFIWIVLTVNLVGLFIVWNIAGYNPFANMQTLSLSTAALFLQVSTAVFTFVGGQITATILREARQLREEARQSAAQLATLNATLEAQVTERTAALQQALHELEQRATEQARLLAENEQQRQAIRELSVPVLPVRETTLVMPLVGALDTARLADMQQQALEQIARTNARDLFIDVTGVPVIDTQVARGLIQVVEAARLMGTRVTLVGIRPEVAQTLVTLGIDLRSIRTFSTLQTALGEGGRR
ncbi:STAS domain-containing protein [Chloroflexus sp.]|uniref:STAS domain-containing protein n=1 Tax=Chloroflexus sp. TaxID=1904827 RepID=UPI002ADD3441|nr:STAS domain-containing protein [Chloroflexus sp.]